MKRRVVLVDDHELFRAGVRGELGDAVDIVGEAATVADAVPLIRELDPDVVLLDVHLPDGNGFDVASRVRGDTAVVMTSTHDGPEFVALARLSGAVGFLPKDALSGDAIDAIVEPLQRDPRAD